MSNSDVGLVQYGDSTLVTGLRCQSKMNFIYGS